MTPFQVRQDDVGKHCHWVNSRFVDYMPTQLDHYKIPWPWKHRTFYHATDYKGYRLWMLQPRQLKICITAIMRSERERRAAWKNAAK